MNQISCPPIAITTGCPSSIGPEVSVAAAQSARKLGIRTILLGDLSVLRRAAEVVGVNTPLQAVSTVTEACRVDDALCVFDAGVKLLPKHSAPGSPSPEGGRAQLRWIDVAVDWAAAGHVSGMVTGPVSKEVIARSGAPGSQGFAGHTEYIARRLGAGPPVMTFVAHDFTVGLVTTHLALADVPRSISPENVSHACVQVSLQAARLLGGHARVVVAALNPHAGENGMFGHEEQQSIVPGVQAARHELRNHVGDFVIDGPIGAEAAFRLAFDGHYDAVVAMYHDQGTIPMKIKFFGQAVNVTAGLPIVRTSVDHGTAYDIAGKGVADPGSMLQAIQLAVRLAGPSELPPT